MAADEQWKLGEDVGLLRLDEGGHIGQRQGGWPCVSPVGLFLDRAAPATPVDARAEDAMASQQREEVVVVVDVVAEAMEMGQLGLGGDRLGKRSECRRPILLRMLACDGNLTYRPRLLVEDRSVREFKLAFRYRDVSHGETRWLWEI